MRLENCPVPCMSGHAVRETIWRSSAISRAAAVLRLLGKSENPLGLNVIARELGL